MRYLSLCTDYDGTLATEGTVFPETVAALERLLASQRRLVLVTGRELDDLQKVCPYLELFEYVVAENGALLYEPSTGKEMPLAQRPPDSFVAALRARGVGPISVGRVIVATWEPHETAVLETIKDHGFELQVIFNKGAVMVLPAGVNKASGLSAALKKMGLSPHNAVGIGDAENDHALLGMCECGVAVANALPTLKEEADFVTTGERGAGVAELISALLQDDLASHEPELTRHHILLGTDASEQEVRVRPYAQNILLAGGDAGTGLIATLLEALAESQYSFCVVDSDGTVEPSPGTVSLGTEDRAPSIEEVLKLFRSPDQSAVIHLTALTPGERQSFFAKLVPHFEELRTRTGRPHWMVVNGEAAPATRVPTPGVLRITPHPSSLHESVLADVNLLLATGHSPHRMIEEFCQITGTPAPRVDPVTLRPGEVLAWRPGVRNAAPFRMSIKPPTR